MKQLAVRTVNLPSIVQNYSDLNLFSIAQDIVSHKKIPNDQQKYNRRQRTRIAYCLFQNSDLEVFPSKSARQVANFVSLEKIVPLHVRDQNS